MIEKGKQKSIIIRIIWQNLKFSVNNKKCRMIEKALKCHRQTESNKNFSIQHDEK